MGGHRHQGGRVAHASGHLSRAPTSLQVAGAAAAATEDCQALVQLALQAADADCARLGPNQAGYGHTLISAELVPGAAGRFEVTGDIVDVNQLQHVSASPLDLTTRQWGVAIFKLLANVPRSLPGQIVTFIVFGNTALDNASGDLQAFYFSSQMGQIACARLPFDGILIHMPTGAGLKFSANGASITLQGTAALAAHPRQSMSVSLADGTASITADGRTQSFGAGQQVQVPLGGTSGLDPSGPPSPPSNDPNSATLSCTLLGANCNPGATQGVEPSQVASAIAQAAATSTATSPASSPASPRAETLTLTSEATATQSALTPTATPAANGSTPTLGPAATNRATPAATATQPPSAVPSSTATALPLPTATLAPPPTSTVPPSATATVSPTNTPAPTATQPPTATTGPCTVSAGGIAINSLALTLPLQNTGGSPVTIATITIAWPNVPASQAIMSVSLAGQQIDSSRYNNTPSQIPSGGIWTVGSPANRQLPPGSAKDLTFQFRLNPSATGYTLTVKFDNGCSVTASR